MKFLTLISFVLSILIFTSPTLAQAQNQLKCDSRDKVLALLAKNYKETPIAVGLDDRGILVELLSSKHGKTWTLILTSPDGNSCLISGGTDWQIKKPTSLDPGA